MPDIRRKHHNKPRHFLLGRKRSEMLGAKRVKKNWKVKRYFLYSLGRMFIGYKCLGTHLFFDSKMYYSSSIHVPLLFLLLHPTYLTGFHPSKKGDFVVAFPVEREHTAHQRMERRLLVYFLG
jgi:hypothetical protein